MRTRIVLLTLVIALATVAVAPAPAAAGPDCVQVYPWSELCKGEAGEVVCYFVPGLPDPVCALGVK